MNLIFFAHPAFLEQRSMYRYSHMLSEGMKLRGHEVQIWSPKPSFFRLVTNSFIKKWLGYIDQYIVFPLEIKKRIKECPTNTLFVFTDHALGPWLHLVSSRPAVIHCHDFLAQRSAIGEFPENPTGFTGRKYQRFIRSGYSMGKNFVSVSEKTREDLHRFLPHRATRSEVVYNGISQNFLPGNSGVARSVLGGEAGIDLKSGYILHIGGNQWYKNRLSVIEIYNAWRSSGDSEIPLVLIGEPPCKKLQDAYTKSRFKSHIHILTGIKDQTIEVAYRGALVFLFPSLEEGFGWPIAEAMASGCPVITTDEAPMTEVAGKAAFLIPRQPNTAKDIGAWYNKAAEVVKTVLFLSSFEKEEVVKRGVENAKRFESNIALDKIEDIYKDIVCEHLEH